MPKFVLIAIDKFGRNWEGIKTAAALADYLQNEFDNHHIVEGTIYGFEDRDGLAHLVHNEIEVRGNKINIPDGHYQVSSGVIRPIMFASEFDKRLAKEAHDLLAAAKMVCRSWESGDLAATVRDLNEVVDRIEKE